MNKRGLLVILSGASGAGKGTVLKEYLSRHADTVVSVSVTTRTPRPGEEDGVHYLFRTRDQVQQMIAEQQFLEYAEYNGNYYGTPRGPVKEWLDKGVNVVLEIDIQGARQVMEREKDRVTVFIMPPSPETLERRLRGRGTETEEQIQNRLAIAKNEMELASLYDHVVINDDLEQAVVCLEQILTDEKQKRGMSAE